MDLILPGFDTKEWEIYTLLLILCGNHSIVIDNRTFLNLNYLTELNASEILPHSFLQRRPIFTTNIDGEFRFHDCAGLTNLDRLQYLNISSLCLYFETSTLVPEEVDWIKDTRGLRYLYMEICYSMEVGEMSTAIATLKGVLSAGLPVLEELALWNDVLGSLDGFPWSANFPNLKKLDLGSYKEIHSNIILQLAVLEYLTVLKLDSLEGLTDKAFTVECLNRFASDNGSGLPSAAPAIACFKQLNMLVIENCNKLTDVSFIEGSAKCGTLEHLEIINCDNLKKNCCKLGNCKWKIFTYE